MSDVTLSGDDELIHEAAILTGLIDGRELLADYVKKEISLILREMRAETECARLAKRIARHFGVKGPADSEDFE